ncbi:MAG: hypothetical protein RL695_990 [Pseudomonadota bacterium]|jgi:type IV pilus assembly protein PilP
MIARTLAMSLLAVLVLAGCAADEHQDLKQWMLDESKDLKGRIPPLPEIKPFPIVSYEAGDRIDAFSASKIEPDKKTSAAGGGLQPDLSRFREPLESYPLESLEMVGVLKEKGRLTAVIRADKTVYMVHAGSYLGQNFGKITRITDGDVQIRELVQDANNDWVERTSSLQLQEQENKK